MGILLRRFWDLCLLRAGPQDLPPSQVLAAVTALAYLGGGVLLLALDGRGLGPAAAAATLDLALLVALLRLALALRGFPRRFRQTFIALTGSGTLLGLLALPVAAVLARAAAEGRAAPAAALAWLALVAWSVLVIGHILRHALSVRLVTGVAAALVYLVVSAAAVAWVFGGGG